MAALELFNREDNKYIDLLLNILLSEKSLNNDEEKENEIEKNITTTINNKLEHAATFFQGLYLFDELVPKISKDILRKYFPHWISKLVQKLSNVHGSGQEIQAVCKSIGILITSCKQEPDLDKKISLYHVKQLVGIIVELHSKKANLSLLNLLTVLLYHYPESCGRLQNSFGKIISLSLDYEDIRLVKANAKCYALLVRANERQFVHSYKENYVVMPDNSSASCHVYYQVNLCHYLHDIMDQLFENFVTATATLPPELRNARQNNILDLPEISDQDISEYYADNINRFANICTFLSTLLRVGNSGRRFTLPNVIIHVACRGLSITPANLKNENESRKDLLLLILPKLYTSLFNVLEALITSFQQELLPFAANIQALIVQTLEWTQTSSSEIFKDIRMCAYKLLSTWMRQTKSLSGFQLVADEVLLHILKDISQLGDKVQMLKPNKNTKNFTKADKAAEKQKSKNTNGAIEFSPVNQTDSTLCIQVLCTVESIISNASYCLKQSFYDRVRNSIVLLLYEQYMKKATTLPADKNNSTSYKLQLLKALRVLETYATGSSSTSHAIHLLELAASQESNAEIVAEARLGLAELRHVIYPSAPTLMLPLERSESSSTDESSSKPSLRLEDIVPIKSALSILEQPVRRALEEESDAQVESKRLKLDEKKIADVTTNGLSSTTSLEENKKNDNDDVDEDEMTLAFCDTE